MNNEFVQWVFFGVLTIMTLGSALLVVISRNLFHAALWLLVSLFGIGGFFAMLAAPFLFAVQVLVYIGAIVILIIIAIMLTRRMMGIEESSNRQWPYALVAAGLAFLVIGAVLLSAEGNQLIARLPAGEPGADSIANLGYALVDLNQYGIPFIVASVFLTGAMIGAISIAREDNIGQDS